MQPSTRATWHAPVAYDDPFQLAVIVGSTRQGRRGADVARWFAGQTERRDDVKLDLIDLAEAAIPATHQAGSLASGRYGSPEVQAFADRVGAADAFVVITPEYNHSYPASLKLAIDSVNPQWHAKPVGFVAYGGLSGGLRAIEHLRVVFAELHTVTIRETVSLHHVQDRFDENGTLRDPDHLNLVAGIFLDQLAWWARALRHATAIQPYPTGPYPAPAP